LGEDPRTCLLLKELFVIGNQGKWLNFQVGNICRSRMESVPLVPVRIPQIAIDRKKSVLNLISEKRGNMEKNIIHSSFACDFKLDNKPAIIQTIAWDPILRIFDRFIPPDIVQVDSSRAHDQKYLAQLFSLS
jgi:hypothetical protein